MKVIQYFHIHLIINHFKKINLHIKHNYQVIIQKINILQK